MIIPPELQFLQPETPLERELLMTEAFREGMRWGVPRRGHPEGLVMLHVAEVLDNVHAMDLSPYSRKVLRLVALSHDTFKYQEEALARNRNHQHHGVIAADFMAQYPVDDVVLHLVRWHDEAYYSWRMTLMNLHRDAEARFAQLYDRLHHHWKLFDAFFKADTLTGDKNPAPLKWVEEQLLRLSTSTADFHSNRSGSKV